jgi:hypothetical protein
MRGKGYRIRLPSGTGPTTVGPGARCVQTQTCGVEPAMRNARLG